MSPEKKRTARAKRTRSRLLVIGGAEDPDPKAMQILPHVVETAGGRRARVVVCGAPAGEPGEKERVYRELFEQIGVAEVYDAQIRTRLDAEAPELLEATERATAVFFTGGDQLRLTTLIAGTPFGSLVHDRLAKDGLVVAGTSAGAAAMSSTMIIGGPADGTVRRGDVILAPGLGYWRDVSIDTHFSERGRVSRMVTIFAQNPQILGIGIDEDTALDVVPGERFTVLGRGAVYVFNGRVTHSNAADVGEDDILALTDMKLHILAPGYGFDLQQKRPLLPDGEAILRQTASR